MKTLIVHAHHEPKSFCSALKETALQYFLNNGHPVQVSDLSVMGFNPVSDRRNFTTVKDPHFLKQQEEERYASENHGFSPEIEAEMEKVEWCDVMIFNFPLWWFSMPAILKGWVDRVFAAGRMYGGQKIYENGVGRGKRALITMTLGGPASMYDGYGINPRMENILQPIQHGIFWFNGFNPLPPFLVHGPARLPEEARKAVLVDYQNYLSKIESVVPLSLPTTDQFEDFSGADLVPRWMVQVRRVKPVDEIFKSRIPAEVHRLLELKNEGKVIFFHSTLPQDPDWVGWLMFRANSEGEVEEALQSLPLHPYLSFKIQRAAKSPLP